MTSPADWQNFAVMAGGASGALTGLLFVAVSLNASRIAAHQGLRASAAQTLVLFLAPLVMAALLLAPGQADWVLGAELIAAGLAASLSLLAIGQRKRGLSDDDKRLVSIFDRRDTNVVVMMLFVAGGAVLASGADAGLYLLLPATIVAFVSGVLNAWNFLLPPGLCAGAWAVWVIPPLPRAGNGGQTGAQTMRAGGRNDMRASRVRTSRRALIVVLAAAVAGAVAGCGGSAAPAAPASRADVSGSWPVAGNDIGDTRDAAGEHIIGPHNVSRLTTAWSVTTAGSVRAPTVDGGVVYFPDTGGKLWAVSAATGTVLWSHEIAGYIGIAGAISRTSPAIYQNELVLGDASYQTLLGYARPLSGAYIFAVDKRTGHLQWRTKVDSHPAAIITGSPVIYRGVVYEGVSSYEEVLAAKPGYHCCTFRGSVVALDAKTGRLLWKTYTMPEGYSGGSVWGSTPAIDPARGLLYVGTGNNYSAPAGVCTAPGETGCVPPAAGDHVDSILALDLKTGAVRWYKSTVTGDVFTEACRQLSSHGCGQDFDFGSGPNLFRLPSGRQLLGIGQKNGIYWALDPATGAVAWKTMAGPGSGYGGIEFGSATDGQRVYVAIGDFYGKPYQITSASGRTSTTSGGSWAALDAATGKILWQTADPQQAADLGFVTTANGLVYAGSTAQNGDDMYVLDAATGTILWRFASGGPVVSGADVAGGSVYWGSGYRIATSCPNGRTAIKVCTGSSHKIYAFRLART